MASDTAQREEAAAIRSGLRAVIEDVAHALFPDAAIDGQEIKFHLPNGEKAGVALRGDKRGAFMNYTTMTGGGPMEMVLASHAGGSMLAAFNWSRSFLGMSAVPYSALSEAERDAMRRDQENRAAERLAASARRRQQSSAGAFSKYLASSREIINTPVDFYLAGRGLLIGPRDGRRGLIIPHRVAGMRYHRTLWHDFARKNFPAMVCPIMDPATREVVAIHATYLAQDAAGRWRKADLEQPRLTHGPTRGGFIPIVEGASGRKWRDAPDEDLLIAEGVEDALTYACRYPHARAIAAIAVGNFAAIDLPANFRTIIWARDNDPQANEATHRARTMAYDRWRSEGRNVVMAPQFRGYKDANDFLQAQIAGTTPPVWLDEAAAAEAAA